MSNRRRRTDRANAAGASIWDVAAESEEEGSAATDAAEGFSDLDVSPGFKSMKQNASAERDDYEVAMTGPAAFMSPAPKKVEKTAPPAVAQPAPAAAEAQAEPAVKRSKVPIFAAVAASLACAGYFASQSLPSATADQSVAPVTVAAVAPQVQQSAALPVAAPVKAAPKVAESVALPIEPLPAPTVVALATTPEVEARPAPVKAVEKPAVQTGSFTPLKAQTDPKPVDTSSLSRADCAARFKTVTLASSVNFESGSATLVPSSIPALHFFATVYEQCKKFKIAVAGHTDSVGDANYNLSLSEKRAKAVARYLVDIGVPSRNLHAVGYGEAQPISGNDTALRRSRNRRIEFMIYGG